MDASTLSAERRARPTVDLARAHAQRRQVDEALARLLEVENVAPEHIRNHRLVRQLVSDLVPMQDPASLGYGNWPSG
ncbi:hypothetical protein AB0K40_39905 [Nonomuraea bangladeshensis]|uniref:Uncharacterized protein n=1 Tax=Nonomuraea bangladeshensis TaxID=404385 RepID=A0ABV3HGQ7_9ACTN